MPRVLAPALMMICQLARAFAFFFLRSKYACCPAFNTASFASLKVVLRRPRKPLALLIHFLCLCFLTTLLFARGIILD